MVFFMRCQALNPGVNTGFNRGVYRMKKQRSHRITLFIIGLIVFMFVVQSVTAEQELDSTIQRETPVVRAVRKVEAAVVNISTEKVVSIRGFNPFGDGWIFDYFDHSYRPRRNVTRQSLGSGVLISSDGVILTNEHVILPASKITVTLKDGREFEAELLGASRRFDLALLKIGATEPLPCIEPGTSADLMIGETVIAIGNPYGLASTVTTGVLSAKDRTITFQDQETRQVHTFTNFLQTDASINPGNSGGPLLNILGELIGINTAIFAEAEGIGFAIPIDKAKRIIDELLEWGDVPRIWLGMLVQDITETLANYLGLNRIDGVLVSDIYSDSPVNKTALKPGDLVIAINGMPVRTTVDFRKSLRSIAPGETVQVTYIQAGIEREDTMIARAVPIERVQELTWDLFGIQMRDITSQDVRKLRLAVAEGVLVTSVRPSSPATQVGIKQGDIIARINNVLIQNTKDFYSQIPFIVQQDSAILVVIRGTNAYRVNVVIQ